MQPEQVTILNNKKHKLIGYLYKNKSKTIVIMCHGLDSWNTVKGLDAVFEAYHRTGASVFYFDFSGYGESEGNKKLRITQRVSDIGSVVSYFASNYKEIILYGVSMSGGIAAIAASKYRKITKLITINGLFSLRIKKLYFRQAIAIYSYLLLHPFAWAEFFYWTRNNQPKELTIPTLIVYGENDTIVKPQQSKDFYRELTVSKVIVSVPKGDHLLMSKEYDKVTIAIPEWIKKQVIFF